MTGPFAGESIVTLSVKTTVIGRKSTCPAGQKKGALSEPVAGWAVQSESCLPTGHVKHLLRAGNCAVSCGPHTVSLGKKTLKCSSQSPCSEARTG